MDLGTAGQVNRNHLTSYSVLMTPGSLLALGWWSELTERPIGVVAGTWDP